jgi:hypothetical protein
MSNPEVAPRKIRIIVHSLTGPDGAEMQTTDDVFDMYGSVAPLSAEQVQVELSTLLAQAESSGFNITVSNESDPLLGMGGYRPKVEIRPSYKLVRAKMDEVQARKEHFAKHGCHGFTVAEPIEVFYGITVRELATRLSVTPYELGMKLMAQGLCRTISNGLDVEQATNVANAFGFRVTVKEEEPESLGRPAIEIVEPTEEERRDYFK